MSCVSGKLPVLFNKNFKRLTEFINQKKYPHGDECQWSFDDFLIQLKMSEDDYVAALRSSVKKPTIFLERLPSELRTNAYNPFILFMWNANMDLQFIVDIYEVARYVTSYMSKLSKGMSMMLRRESKHVKETT